MLHRRSWRAFLWGFSQTIYLLSLIALCVLPGFTLACVTMVTNDVALCVLLSLFPTFSGLMVATDLAQTALSQAGRRRSPATVGRRSGGAG